MQNLSKPENLVVCTLVGADGQLSRLPFPLKPACKRSTWLVAAACSCEIASYVPSRPFSFQGSEKKNLVLSQAGHLCILLIERFLDLTRFA